MTKRFTDLQVIHAKAGTSRREIPVTGVQGLYLVVQVSGRKSWAVRYRFFNRPRKLTLPAGIGLATARTLAAKALEQVARGVDPAEERKAANAKANASRENSLQAVCENYLKREGARPLTDKKRLRTLAVREATLRRLVFPSLGKMPIEAVRRSNLTMLFDKIEDENGPRMADIVLAYLRKIMNWHASRSDEFRSPVIRGMTRYDDKAHQRERVLTDPELRAVWAASETGAFGQLVRFLLLTGCRRSEGAGLTWDEIDADGIWHLPAIRNKNKTDLARPLSEQARRLIDAQPIIEGEPRVFGALGFSVAKSKFDALSGTSGWTLHDLRRSARSLMSRADVRPDIGERVLGHVVGGVAGVYDRHGYVEQMRPAVEALATLIERIVNPPADVVTPMRPRRSRAP